jgi:type I restriction enzyme M protein
MLIKGQDVSRIKLGNTLSNDQLPQDQFDYMLSNPPFGVDWKKIEGRLTTNIRRKALTVALARACRVFPMARCCS